VDSVSTVTQPTLTLLRRTDGTLVGEVARADASALLASGWQAPEPFCAKAADGQTDLYGVIVKPRRFDATRRYPVIERIYGGPQINAQPRTFLEGINGAFMYGVNALAEMGFVVVVMDGPGTPLRSKAFHDQTWNQADRWGIAHHRAAIEGAAATRPWMDLARVGLSGHSYGGYATAMAMLLEPGF
jgi:dipeptidyl aminopeptidase/acylaminoacyl peptidase